MQQPALTTRPRWLATSSWESIVHFSPPFFSLSRLRALNQGLGPLVALLTCIFVSRHSIFKPTCVSNVTVTVVLPFTLLNGSQRSETVQPTRTRPRPHFLWHLAQHRTTACPIHAIAHRKKLPSHRHSSKLLSFHLHRSRALLLLSAGRSQRHQINPTDIQAQQSALSMILETTYTTNFQCLLNPRKFFRHLAMRRVTRSRTKDLVFQVAAGSPMSLRSSKPLAPAAPLHHSHPPVVERTLSDTRSQLTRLRKTPLWEPPIRDTPLDFPKEAHPRQRLD